MSGCINECKNECECGREHKRERDEVVALTPPFKLNIIWASASSATAKTCSTCKVSKPLDAFCKNKKMVDGKNTVCKPCISKKEKENRVINKDKNLAKVKILRNRTQDELDEIRRKLYGEDLSSAMKTCTSCKQSSLLANYHNCATWKDGLSVHCKDCLKLESVKQRNDLRNRSDDKILQDRRRCHPDDTKQCSKCTETFPVANFSTDILHLDGLNSWCKSCTNEKGKLQYRKVVEFKRTVKEGKCCEICSCNIPSVLDFAHVDRSTKYRSRTNKLTTPGELNLHQLKLEIPKTILLCAFCHRLETARENKENYAMTSSAISSRKIRGRVRAETSDKEKLKRLCCIDCNRKTTPDTLYGFDFDHLPEHVKIECISHMVSSTELYTYEDIVSEMAKCELRCANCHIIKTAERRSASSASA
jgi:hypothetical protein